MMAQCVAAGDAVGDPDPATIRSVHLNADFDFVLVAKARLIFQRWR
jgi:hypothetical protein